MGSDIRLFRILLSLLLFAILTLQTAAAAVWHNENEWNDSWEQAYSQWVKTKWTTDFFLSKKNADYFGIEHDCGDVAYFMRLVFSRENGLPFVVHHPLKPGVLIGNSTRLFDKEKDPIKRLHLFMNYIGNIASTRSLAADTFPIVLAELRPGDIYLAPGRHNYQIRSISDTGVPTLVSSSTPKQSGLMSKHSSFPFYVPSDAAGMTDGYRRFRQPRDLLKRNTELQGFSAEQYTLAAEHNYNFVEFSNYLASLLGTRSESGYEAGSRMLLGLCEAVETRSQYVDEGVAFLKKKREKRPNACMSKAEYYEYSTDSRDKRLVIAFNQARKSMYNLMSTGGDPRILQVMRMIFDPPGMTEPDQQKLNAICSVSYSPEHSSKLNLQQVWQLIRYSALVSDPHADREQRWGLGSSYTAQCPTYGS